MLKQRRNFRTETERQANRFATSASRSNIRYRTRTPGRFALPAAAQQTPDTDAGHHDGGDVQQHLRKTLR